MSTPRRLSPIHESLQQIEGTWSDINGMPALIHTSEDARIAKTLGIADLSSLGRFGVKGAGAAAWLAHYGITVEQPNRWTRLAGGLAIRLGLSEYLIEDSLSNTSSNIPSNTLPNTMVSRLAAGNFDPDQVYPVLRQDLALALWGEQVPALMLQTCNFNFRALTLAENPVVLTTMIGVAVTVLPSERNGLPFYRIWCDGTFGNYFWHTLLAIAQELGGGVIGTTSILFP
ncbi:MAG: methylglutamate dehydrogenase [Cyanobacteria bacterium RM1_2_2]|nr:methylglutamate dehydrogenase [Cyanobacteria bacterium RM1_2_2]